MLTTDETAHESVIGDFYSEFPYPWHVSRLARPDDATLVPAMTSQELGDFGHTRMPVNATIWVPGCGVNQALIMALRCPGARVLGSDVSDESLRLCATAARQVGVTNLELRREGISEAGYSQEFDYIACTGVVHHNPDPAALLRHLAAGLKPSGVLELMVYNSFHRREIAAFQEASAILGCGGDLGDAQRLARALRVDNVLTGALLPSLDEPDVKFADTWLNPYERSFTVGSLGELAGAAGLVLEAPCVSPATVGQEFFRWDAPLSDDRLRWRCERLPDAQRWQLANLLLADKSPLLWFYLRHADDPLPLLAESDRDQAFLRMVPVPANAAERVWTLQASGGYLPLEARPESPRLDQGARPVLELADGRRAVAEILAVLGLKPAPWELRHLRTTLTTPAFPLLRAVR